MKLGGHHRLVAFPSNKEKDDGDYKQRADHKALQ